VHESHLFRDHTTMRDPKLHVWWLRWLWWLFLTSRENDSDKIIFELINIDHMQDVSRRFTKFMLDVTFGGLIAMARCFSLNSTFSNSFHPRSRQTCSREQVEQSARRPCFNRLRRSSLAAAISINHFYVISRSTSTDATGRD
jgi:hypothetical protein